MNTQNLFLTLVGVLIFSLSATAQNDAPQSTIEFVEILNDNRDEALHYYEHNWAKLREQAIDKGYIMSYQLMECESTIEAPFNILLITTYANQDQYEAREANFAELMENSVGLILLNETPPNEFRKSLYVKESAALRLPK